MIVKGVFARKILTCNGKETIEVTVNKKYSASVPLGTSTGSSEVMPFPGIGVDFAVKYINSLNDLIGLEFKKFDDLKQVEKYSRVLKGNPILALQYALLKAMSDNEIFSFLNPHPDVLPIPLGNVIGGGAHFKGNAPDFQEFMLVPQSKSFSENAFANEYVHKQIGRIYPSAKKTIEGAYALNLNNIRVLDVLKKTIEKSSRDLGFDIDIGIDIAASSFFKAGKYSYKNYSYSTSRQSLSKKDQISFINKLVENYELKYIEDPLNQNDFKGFKDVKAPLVCADDLVCTNIERLKRAIGSINAVIIKPNQIGSLIKTKEIVDFAAENSITPVISHRSSETADATISHLAVAWDIPYIKLGIYGKERIAKINELREIEKKI